MDVVTTLVLVLLDLNTEVVDLELFSKDFVNGIEHILVHTVLVKRHVARHGQLPVTDGPHVQVVHITDPTHLHQ